MRLSLPLLLCASLRLAGADWSGQWSDAQLTLQLQGPAQWPSVKNSTSRLVPFECVDLTVPAVVFVQFDSAN